MTLARARILWADDNAQDRMLIQDALAASGTGAQVTLVADGVLLLEALEGTLPDLVVLDLKMPRLGGIEVLRRMRAHPVWKDVTVVIFSSGNRPEEIATCRVLGVSDVVQKPVDFDLLSAAVRRVVGGVADFQGGRLTPPNAQRRG